MALSSYRMCDARKTFRLGEAAGLWGGTDEKFATPTPLVIIPDPPPRDDEASFANFAQPREKSDATFAGVFESNKARMFTKEAAPSGYAVLQKLKEAADNGELPVLDSLPSGKMTRVRREDLEAFAKRMLAEHDWPLPWFLFPGERPPPKNRSNDTGRAHAQAEFEKLRRGTKKKTTPEYLAWAENKFRINNNNARNAYKEAAINVQNSDWSRHGPKIKNT